MKAYRGAAVAFTILLMLLVCRTAQRDVQARTGSSTSGAISGTVIAAESGNPVPFVSVRLKGAAGQRETTTDAAGSFSFGGVERGAYVLQAAKPGYVATVYGQRRPGTDTPGDPVRLENNQVVSGLRVPISKGSSVAGVVRSTSGEPVYQATVRVSRWVTSNGLRTLETVSTAETDERGAFRIPLLPPRRYLLSAEPPSRNDSSKAEPLMPIFFPHAVTAADAGSIELGRDEHRAGLHLTLPAANLSRIRGIVVDQSGQPVPGIQVTVESGVQSALFESWGTSTNPDGTFEIGRVLPGQYVLRAGERFSGDGPRWTVFREGVVVALGKGTRAIEPDAESPSKGYAIEEVIAGNTPEISVVMRLNEPRAIKGRVTVEGRASALPAGVTLRFIAVDSLGEFQPVAAAADGSFVLPHVSPGRYRLQVEVEGPWTPASAVSGGLDILDAGIVVPPDRDVTDLVVTLTNRPIDLKGLVTDNSARPVTARTVVVFAEGEPLWASGSRRVQAVDLGADGRYQFTGLAPGDYRMVVVDALERDEWLDPPVLRQWLTLGQSITLRAGAQHVQDFRVR